ISHEIAPVINQVDARVQNFEIQFLQEAAKFIRDFKSLAKEADESLDKQKSLELEIERLLKESVSYDIMSIVQNSLVDVPSDLRTELDRTKEKLELCIIKKEKEYAVLWNNCAVTPLSKKLHVSIPSHSVPQPREFNVVKHRNVIAPGMFKINPSQMPRVDLVPNKQSSASIRTIPITNSQRHVTVKENMSSNMATASSTGLVHTARTRRPQPKGNTRNARVPSASKSSEVKKCNCRRPPLDCIVFQESENYVWKPKQVGSKERLASKPRLPRLSLKWSPSGRSFDQKGKLVASKETNCPNDDKACTSNTQEPMRKQFPNSSVFLGRLSKFVYGYGDLKWGNITITRVYFVEGLGHNLFSVGQFCDADLEVAFRRNTCLIRDLDDVDLLKGNRKSKGASHPPKPVLNSKHRLPLLHMDLCGPMRVGSINGKRYVLVIVDDYSRYTWVHFLKTKDETPEQNGVVERRNRTLVEAAKTILIFSHAPLFLWAEAIATACYTQTIPLFIDNDREDIGKLGAKGDIGFFIGYSANSIAYRVYNGRTRKIMKTMNVTSELELNYALLTITPQRPSERDLDILFEPLHNEYLGGRPEEAPRAIRAAPVEQNLQALIASMSVQDSASVPTNSSMHNPYPTTQVTMEILLEPTSNKLLVGDVGDSIWIKLVTLDINLGPK
nr:hypothetical protein [Tanacetum cinerariifolium]